MPASFSFALPAGATVKQALLYWEGHFTDSWTSSGDDRIAVNGNDVQGTVIGGPTRFFPSAAGPPETHGFESFATYRADITSLGLVSAGLNTITVGDMLFGSNFPLGAYQLDQGNDGVGVIVIFDTGGSPATIEVRDGLDLAFANFAAPLEATVPQTFTFAPDASDGTANLATLAGSVRGEDRDELRSNQLAITFDVGGTGDVVLNNPFQSNQGFEWDALNIPVTVPAGATQMTVEAISGGLDGFLASLAWNAASLAVPAAARTGDARTPGFWRNWASCSTSSGNQDPVLDETLVAAGGSILIGKLTVDTCLEAVRILATRDVRTDATMSSHPAYRLASHLLAPKLNVLAGAATCAAANDGIASAQTLLNQIKFKGIGSPSMTSAQTNLADSLQATLDRYSNNSLC
jgi:hypothetical protein